MNLTTKANSIKEHKSAPVSPRFMNDTTKASSSDPNHTSDALDQRLASVAISRKLHLAATESYPGASNATKPESVSSPDAAKLKSFVDYFPSSNQEPSIDP